MNKFASIDFEYNDTAEEKLNVVCCSIRHDDKDVEFWTHFDDVEQEKCLQYIDQLHKDGYTFLAYNVIAEASAIISLGGTPLKYKWIDLYLEYRCLSNHNDNYAYGKQLVKGRKKFTKRPLPKWERKTEADHKKADATKQEYGMGAAVYKTLGKVIDSDFKNAMRDIIIRSDRGEIEANKEEIQLYCTSDVKYLEPMFKEMIDEYKRLLGSYYNGAELVEEVFYRARYAVRSAIMERVGYPINYDQTRNFSDQVPNILWECQHDINGQFPQFTEKVFRPTVKKRPFDLSWNQKFTRSIVREWCDENNYKGWILTDGGKSGVKDLSLSLKAFQKPISYRHNYPEGNFIAQMQRFLKLKQGLNGFLQGKGTKKKRFWDNVGSDGRVRPFMGIYGAQSARSQPSATGFIPLKSAWMRSLIAPAGGRAICGIDFASQEFLLAALLSGDAEMLKAYESGDVYLAFGKAIGYIPQNGTKKTHKKERDECKAVVLGLSYDMSEYGLALDLSEKFGRKVTPEEALTWINKHKSAYKRFWAWKKALQKEYRLKKFLKLSDGWYLWGDNDNFRSTGNFPVQGMGSCIMRKAVELAQDRGLDVIYTLHDAIYIESDTCDIKDNVKLLASAMDDAFRHYFKRELRKKATVRLDADVWSPDFCGDTSKYTLVYPTSVESYNIEVKQQQVYIDERSLDDYNKFSKYFNKEEYGELSFA